MSPIVSHLGRQTDHALSWNVRCGRIVPLSQHPRGIGMARCGGTTSAIAVAGI